MHNFSHHWEVYPPGDLLPYMVENLSVLALGALYDLYFPFKKISIIRWISIVLSLISWTKPLLRPRRTPDPLRQRLRTVVPTSSLIVLGWARAQTRSVRKRRQHLALSELPESPPSMCWRHQSSPLSNEASFRRQKDGVSQAFQLLQTVNNSTQ